MINVLKSILKQKEKIAYQSGKGSNHLAPVLIPEDTVRAMEVLCDLDIRREVGVLESNVYAFPSCHNLENGNSAVKRPKISLFFYLKSTMEKIFMKLKTRKMKITNYGVELN